MAWSASCMSTLSVISSVRLPGADRGAGRRVRHVVSDEAVRASWRPDRLTAPADAPGSLARSVVQARRRTMQPELDDQARLLGDRDEVERREITPRRGAASARAPRIETSRSCAQVDDRLVVRRRSSPLLERPRAGRSVLEARDRAGAHRLVEQL